MSCIIYLAGSINGCTNEECKDWREYIKAQWGADNCLDPMRRDYRGKETGYAPIIVEGDKADILASDWVLVNYDKPSVGTSMEIMFAWEHDKPVVVVARPQEKLSPWLIYHAEAIADSFEAALEYIKEETE